jgi:PIN domain nuclease of toxin-antitoxin system
MQINSKSKNKKHLLDTSALIALLKKEPGYEEIEDIIANSAISSVNLSELVAVLARSGISDLDIDEMIKDIVPEIIPFCEYTSIKAGKLLTITKTYGLSLGDRACIATGDFYEMEIHTTDKAWLKVQSEITAKITVIR